MMRTKMDGPFLYSLMCGTDAPVHITTAMEMGLYFLQLYDDVHISASFKRNYRGRHFQLEYIKQAGSTELIQRY